MTLSLLRILSPVALVACLALPTGASAQFVTVNDSQVLTVRFRLPQGSSINPDVLGFSLAMTNTGFIPGTGAPPPGAQPTTVALHNGRTLLGTFVQAPTSFQQFYWTSPSSAWPGASGSQTQTVDFTSIWNGSIDGVITLHPGTGRSYAIDPSCDPTGQRLCASGGGYQFFLGYFDAATGQLHGVISGTLVPQPVITEVSVSPFTPPLVLPLADPTVTQDFNCFDCVGNGKFHTGMDFTSASSTVVAAASGEVHAIYRADSTANVWCDGGNDRLDQITKTDHEYGNTIILKHTTDTGANVFTQYSHLHCISKAVALRVLEAYPSGDPRRQVTAQTHLGNYGGSGTRKLDKWPRHLHFEVKNFGELVGSDPTNKTDIFSYSPASGELYGYIDPAKHLYRDEIDTSAIGMGIVLDDATIAYEAPGLAIASSDAIKNKLPANALVYIISTARMTDGDWYQVNLGMPTRAYVDKTTMLIDNNSPEGWVHSRHIAAYFGFTFEVPGPQGVLVSVYDAPDGAAIGKVLGGQVFQRYGQLPANTKGKKLCATQWVEINVGAVISGPDTASTRQRGWVCDSTR